MAHKLCDELIKQEVPDPSTFFGLIATRIADYNHTTGQDIAYFWYRSWNQFEYGMEPRETSTAIGMVAWKTNKQNLF